MLVRFRCAPPRGGFARILLANEMRRPHSEMDEGFLTTDVMSLVNNEAQRCLAARGIHLTQDGVVMAKPGRDAAVD